MATWRQSDSSPVERDQALAAWAAAARQELLRIARRYHATITYAELAEHVQAATGIRTDQLFRGWINRVLYLTSELKQPGEPELTSLVVYAASGGVGSGFDNVIDADGDEHQDRDQIASAIRLDCYRYFKAPDLPADGGVPALSPANQARLRKEKERLKKAAPRPACPSCGGWKALSADLCDDCA